MRRPWAWWLAWGLWLFTGVCGAALTVLIAVTERTDLGDTSTYLPAVLAAFVAFQSFATVGALVASRQSRNPIGWLFLASAALCQWANVLGSYAYFAEERGLPGVVWPAVVFAPAWLVGVLLVALFGFQLFPTGRPVSDRWRWLVWASAGVLALASVGLILTPGEIESVPKGHENPLGVAELDKVAGALWLALLVALLLSIASLVVRFRRSRGVERKQLTLVAATVCLVVAVLAAFALLDALVGLDDTLGANGDVAVLLMFALIPASVGAAMLRYRLYEIDRVISRALVYAGVTVLLGASYVGLVLVGQAIFSSFAGGSDLAIAASTLVVAALFLPVRSRVQRFVDRRFYRRRYDAQRTLEQFGSHLREQIDLTTLEHDLQGVVAETMQPTHTSLWLRTGAPS